jgi:hypothetical protein
MERVLSAHMVRAPRPREPMRIADCLRHAAAVVWGIALSDCLVLSCRAQPKFGASSGRPTHLPLTPLPHPRLNTPRVLKPTEVQRDHPDDRQVLHPDPGSVRGNLHPVLVRW